MRWLGFGIALALGALMIALAALLYLPGREQGAPLELSVSPGMTLADVADTLSGAGMIRSRTAFVFAGRLSGVDTRIHTGRYRFPPGQSTLEILRSLRAGRVVLKKLTIPEGLTVEQTAERIAAQTEISAEAFLDYADALDVSAVVGFPCNGMEGYLFPNTYMVSDDVQPEEIIRLMMRAFHEAVGGSFLLEAEGLGLSPAEVITLASIIEKEARVPEERARISAVFHNRLKRGMKLEADPTVRYALKRWEGLLTYEDLKVDSPYNTYQVSGLPPGPIASPGKASIDAALHPVQDARVLYFVARGDGTHQFSETLTEHLRAKDAMKRARRRSS